MFGPRVHLFSLFGFKVGVDLSWLLLALLITWTLAEGYFPVQTPDLATATYWWMGVAGALGLFFSIIFHEFSHSLVARRYDLPISGITLFIFGGVAQMEEEPQSAKAEFAMAIAGPIASFILAAAFYAVFQITAAGGLPVPVSSTLQYLALINLVLAVFNLIPAFPLDGGRVLRAILWGWKDDLRWASHTAARFGSAFGMLLIILGAVSVVAGNLVGGIWWFLIGLFIRTAARSSFQQTVVSETLRGVPVKRLMIRDLITVPPETTISDFVENYFHRYYHKLYPMMADGRLDGCLLIRDVQHIHRDEWATTPVSEIARPCDDALTIGADTGAMEAMQHMRNTGNSRLLVLDKDGGLAGLITMKDIMAFLSFRLEVEQNIDNPLARMEGESLKHS